MTRYANFTLGAHVSMVLFIRLMRGKKYSHHLSFGLYVGTYMLVAKSAVARKYRNIEFAAVGYLPLFVDVNINISTMPNFR